MRLVLGVMYDKYETFNLYLYQINQGPGFGATVPITALNETLVDIRISGLQFLNNGYNCVTRNNTTTAFLTSYILNNSKSDQVGTVTPMFNPTIITFGKNVECVDININMLKTMDKKYPTIASTTVALGTFSFMFKIYGIPKKEQNLINNGTRMNISSSR